LKPVDTLEDLRLLLLDKRITAICAGPGAGITDALRKSVMRMLKSGRDLVLDADALTVFEDNTDCLFAAIKNDLNRTVVLTPHEGEFKRLFSDLGDISDSKVERARKAAARSGAIIVLKGSDTVIAHPNAVAKVNTNGLAKLATAGSGDVLAGAITSLLAQGMDPFNAACAGVWLHAHAANKSGRHAIIAEDLIDGLGF
jgi:ADP-dependent NAD(P)H-hydrate dehydratase / NAD(P)H-hydrate epimerase